jgi:chemotaxis protein MotB
MSGGGKFQEEEEHENHERWLVTYADMITLLTCFFIMLYSMSVINLAKFQKLAISVRSGSKGEMKSSVGMSIVEKGQVSTLEDPHLPEQIDQAAKAIAPIPKQHEGDNAAFAGAAEGLEALIPDIKAALGEDSEVKLSRHGLDWVLEIAGEKIFFAPDSAELTDEARAAMLKVAPSLVKVAHVQVEGFSSSTPSGGFELSSARALAVVEVLQQGSVPEQSLSATGFGVRAPGSLGGRDYVRIMLKR